MAFFTRMSVFAERERLFGEIVSAELGGAHSGFNGAMAGNHDDFGRVLERANFLQHFQAVDAGQPHIEQHHVNIGFAQLRQAIFAARADGRRVAFVLENTLQRFADGGFVVDDQDVGHGSIQRVSVDILTCRRCTQRFDRNRQLNHKAAANGLIFLYADGAVVVLHDSAYDRQAQACAALLG